MRLDNFIVKSGDRLFCQLEGTFGFVLSANEEFMSIRFGSVKFNYRYDGERMGSKPDRIGRTLFWDDPTNYFIPTNDPAFNEYMKTIAHAVSQLPRQS